MCDAARHRVSNISVIVVELFFYYLNAPTAVYSSSWSGVRAGHCTGMFKQHAYTYYMLIHM
jgi:hypothetical protein